MELIKLSSNYLLENGMIFLNAPIDDDVANSIISQLLYLNTKYPDRSIQLIISSPGGSVGAGYGIYDVMNYIKPPIETIAIGAVASMAAFLLSSGTRGKRCALPNAEILIHQPMGETSGQATDILLAAEHIKKTRERMERVFSCNTGKSVEQIHADIERDKHMLAQEAKEYGLIDHIIETTPKAFKRHANNYFGMESRL